MLWLNPFLVHILCWFLVRLTQFNDSGPANWGEAECVQERGSSYGTLSPSEWALPSLPQQTCHQVHSEQVFANLFVLDLDLSSRIIRPVKFHDLAFFDPVIYESLRQLVVDAEKPGSDNATALQVTKIEKHSYGRLKCTFSNRHWTWPSPLTFALRKEEEV